MLIPFIRVDYAKDYNLGIIKIIKQAKTFDSRQINTT